MAQKSKTDGDKTWGSPGWLSLSLIMPSALGPVLTEYGSAHPVLREPPISVHLLAPSWQEATKLQFPCCLWSEGGGRRNAILFIAKTSKETTPS